MTRSVELENRRPRRWKRRLAIGFAVVVVLLLAAAWQLPWLLGTAPGRAFIASKLSTDSMRFSIDSLDLAWSGDQAVGGVRILDAQEREVADVSAAFKGSLWSWARGSRDFGSVSVAGTVTVYESPSTGRPRPEPSPGGAPPPRTTGGSGDLSGVVIPEGVKASLNLDALTVKYVPVPGSSQPPMAVRDVKGSLAVDGRSPVTLTLAGATEIGDSIGSFEIDASISDFAAADGSLQPDRATFTAAIAGERLPAPIIDRLAGQQGRLTALLGESIDLTMRASGGADGGEATVNARSERATAELSATVDAQRRLTLTRGRAMLKASQQTLEALLSAEQLAGLSLTEEATAVLDVSRLTVQLPDSGGAFDLSKSVLDATLSIAAAAIETGREDLAAATVRDLAVRITSDDPTREIRLTAGAQVISRLAGESEPVEAPFDADLALVRAFKADGAWSGETLGLAGTVRISDVPTSLVDALAGAEGWIADALGPMIGRVELTAGSDASADRSTLIGLSLSAPEAQASASLRLADGRVESVSGRPIEAAAAIRPALRDRLASMLAESAPQVRLEEGGRVTLRVTSLSMTMPGGSQPQPWKAAAIEGSLILQNARGTYAPAAGEDSAAAAPKRYDVESLAAEFRTAAVGESLAAQVRAAVRQDDVPLSMSGRAEVLSAFDAEKRQVTIEMDETTAPPEIITAWAPGREAMIGEVLGGPVRLALNAMHYAGGLSANASMRGERSEAQLTYAMQAGRTLFELRGSQRATPALVAALLGPDPAVVLVEPADVAYTLTMPEQSAPGAAFGAWPLKLDASTPRAVIAMPRQDGGSTDATPGRGAPPAQSATLTAVDFTLRSDWPQGLDGAGRYAFTAAVTDGVAAIASLSGDASYTIGGDWKKSRGRVEAKGIDVAALERTLGVSPGTLSAWLGARGGLEVGSVVDAQGQLTDDLLVAAQFDRASGRLAGRLAEDRLIINTPGTISANLERGRLGQLLSGWAGGAAAPTSWAALEDANLSATIRSISLPLAALSGESYDPALLSIDADVNVPRLALRHGSTDLSLADTALKIGGASLAEGLTAQLKAATQTGAAAPAGGIDLNALVRSATSNAEDRRYTVRGSMRGVPVAIVDAIARMEGKLVAAVGPSMDMQLNLAEAHRNGGSLTASIVTPNGTLNVPKADLRDNTLVIESANPVAASLEVTPEMSASLLSNVNPLLYDVRKKAGPIAFNAPRLVLPLDGDVSKLGGQFTLDLGQLYVPTKGILGEFLGQLKPRTDQSEPDRVETTIPPITGRINKGVLEYDKFIMQSQAFEITTSGKVDLVKRRLDLLAAVPLIGWKSVFADMTKIAPAFLTDIPVNVPFYLVVRGPIDKPEIKPDPKGAQRVADEFFRNIGGNLIDNVFDNIFKPRR